MSEYDQFAQDFSDTRDRPWPEFEVFMSDIKTGQRILDLGCGNARLRKYLPETLIRPGDYFGFDISEKLLQIARKKFPKDAFFRGNFGKNLPFGAQNFDWVISIAAFHHLLNKKDQHKFLSEMTRVLKPGGKIFITTWVLPKKYFWYNLWRGRTISKNWIIPFGKDKHPRTYRNIPEHTLEKLLRAHDFKIIRCEQFQDRNYIVLAQKLG